MMGFWDGSGISWIICKQSAPCSRQITTPTPHHAIFTGQMHFLTPNQSSEGRNKQTQYSNSNKQCNNVKVNGNSQHLYIQ